MKLFDFFPPALGTAPREVDLPDVDIPTKPDAPVIETELPEQALSVLPEIALETLAERYPGSLGDDDTGDEPTNDIGFF